MIEGAKVRKRSCLQEKISDIMASYINSELYQLKVIDKEKRRKMK